MSTEDKVTGPVNLGNPTEFTMRQLAEEVLRLTASTSKMVQKPLPPDDPRKRQPDISLARRELGWKPTISLTEGLERTIAYFRESMGM
jgi:UDP-glucuronate decarboxylase